MGVRIGFGLYQSWRNRGKVGSVSVLVAVVWVVLGGSGWAAWTRVWKGGVVLSLCFCESGLRLPLPVFLIGVCSITIPIKVLLITDQH